MTRGELLARVRTGEPMHAVGSGTKRHHGRTGTGGELPMRPLSAIVHYEPGDLVVGVEAGARLADVQAELGKHGQWLPLDPPHADATIGGILATNSSGPRRLGYGTMRDLLIGLAVVGNGGAVTRSGGRVVKNVTGYDLHKLHIGAFGTLGVLLEANFKVRPLPEVSAVIAAACGSVSEAHALCLKIFDSPLRPVALEALDGRLKDVVDGAAVALVGVEGTRPVLERHAREIRKLAPSAVVLEGERADAVWAALRDLPGTLKSRVRVRIGAKPTELPGLLPEGPLWVRAGNGLAWVDLDPADGPAERIADWHRRASARGGYAVVESAPPGMTGRDALPWGPTGNALMEAIRRSRDPKGIFNPGRMAV